MSDNSQDRKRKVTTQTIVAIVLQVILGLCLWASAQVTSNTPLSAIPMGICLIVIVVNVGIYVLLFGYFFGKGNLFARPLLAIVLFWLIVAGVPYTYYQIRDRIVDNKRDKRTKTLDEATAEGFKNYAGPLLEKTYRDVTWREEKRCYEVRHGQDTFMVGFDAAYDQLLLNLSQRVFKIPSEFDTAFWLGKANLIRPLMVDDDKKRLDSLQTGNRFRITKIGERNPSGPLGDKEIRIVNNSVYKPAGPLEIDAFFNYDKYCLWVRYLAPHISVMLHTPVRIQISKE